MWGQPPPAVRASEARLLRACLIPELGKTFLKRLENHLAFRLIPLQSTPAELRSADSRGRLSPHTFSPRPHFGCLRLSIGGSFLIFRSMTSLTSSLSAPTNGGFFLHGLGRSRWNRACMITGGITI